MIDCFPLGVFDPHRLLILQIQIPGKKNKTRKIDEKISIRYRIYHMSSEISINKRKITKCFVFPKNPYRIATSTLLALSSLFNLLDPEHCFLKLLLLLLLVCSYVLDVCLLQKNYRVLTMSGPGLQGIEALTSAMQTNIIPDQEYLLQVTVRETRNRLTDEKCCRAGSGGK